MVCSPLSLVFSKRPATTCLVDRKRANGWNPDRAQGRVNVDVVAYFYFSYADFGVGMKAEALAVDYLADVGACLAVSPKVECLLDNELADAIVVLDESGDFGCRFLSLRGSGVKANARDILGENRNEGEAEGLVSVADELITRRIFEPDVVHQFVLEG